MVLPLASNKHYLIFHYSYHPLSGIAFFLRTYIILCDIKISKAYLRWLSVVLPFFFLPICYILMLLFNGSLQFEELMKLIRCSSLPYPSYKFSALNISLARQQALMIFSHQEMPRNTRTQLLRWYETTAFSESSF